MIYLLYFLVVSFAALFGFSVGFGVAKANTRAEIATMQAAVERLTIETRALEGRLAGMAASPPSDDEFDELLQGPAGPADAA